MILEYLGLVKKKIAAMERKLEDSQRENEFSKRKGEDLQRTVEELRERENMMTLKFGVLVNQNQELQRKLEKKRETISSLRKAIMKLSYNNTVSQALFGVN